MVLFEPRTHHFLFSQTSLGLGGVSARSWNGRMLGKSVIATECPPSGGSCVVRAIPRVRAVSPGFAPCGRSPGATLVPPLPGWWPPSGGLFDLCGGARPPGSRRLPRVRALRALARGYPSLAPAGAVAPLRGAV